MIGTWDIFLLCADLQKLQDCAAECHDRGVLKVNHSGPNNESCLQGVAKLNDKDLPLPIYCERESLRSAASGLTAKSDVRIITLLFYTYPFQINGLSAQARCIRLHAGHIDVAIHACRLKRLLSSCGSVVAPAGTTAVHVLGQTCIAGDILSLLSKQARHIMASFCQLKIGDLSPPLNFASCMCRTRPRQRPTAR